jgi:hypothetical protein
MSQQNCEFSGVYKGGGGTWQAAIRVGSDIVATLDLGSVTDGRQFSLNYPCNGVTSVGFRTTASASQLTVDELYFGIARNIGTVAQATFVGGMEQAAASGCEYSENTSTGLTNFVSLGTGTGCNAWTVTSNGPGVISAIGNNDHRLTYTNMPAGNYQIIIQGKVRSPAGLTCYFRLSDGTNNFQPQAVASGATDISAAVLVFSPTYSSEGTRTFTVQASDNHASSCMLSNTFGGMNLSWKIYRFPTREEQVLRHDQVAWRVDANIGGANPSLGTGNVSSYTEITNGSLDLVNNSGPGVIPAQIPCSGTNPPTGLTCSAGNESVGVSFNLPAAGEVRACVSFTHQITVNNGDITSAFQIVETPNNAQTILQEGGARIQSTHGNNAGSSAAFPYSLCGTFKFTSAGQKTLRLMYEQGGINGTINYNGINADRNINFGQRDIHWEVYPLNTYQPAPLLIGSVISGSSGIERVERAFTLSNCTSSPCTLTSQSGGVSSVTRSGTGAYNINFSPPFSAQPTCTANCTVVGTIEAFADVIISGTGSVSNVTCRRRDNGAVADAAFSVICMGPR